MAVVKARSQNLRLQLSKTEGERGSYAAPRTPTRTTNNAADPASRVGDFASRRRSQGSYWCEREDIRFARSTVAFRRNRSQALTQASVLGAEGTRVSNQRSAPTDRRPSRGGSLLPPRYRDKQRATAPLHHTPARRSRRFRDPSKDGQGPTRCRIAG